MSKMKFMKPEDCTKYANVSAQYIREVMKRDTFDLGYCTNTSGKRFKYLVIPEKFFGWLNIDVPEEWR